MTIIIRKEKIQKKITIYENRGQEILYNENEQNNS